LSSQIPRLSRTLESCDGDANEIAQCTSAVLRGSGASCASSRGPIAARTGATGHHPEIDPPTTPSFYLQLYGAERKPRGAQLCGCRRRRSARGRPEPLTRGDARESELRTGGDGAAHGGARLQLGRCDRDPSLYYLRYEGRIIRPGDRNPSAPGRRVRPPGSHVPPF